MMDSKKEKLLKGAYDAYINLMLYDFPIDRVEDVVDNDVTGYGTTTDERVLEIKRLVQIVTDQREQGAGIEMHIKTIPVHRRISPDEDTAIFMDEFEISMVINGAKNMIPLRLTSVFEFRDKAWKLVHLHGSKAVETEGDTWHLDEWKKKNEELQKLVDEKTADLVSKNHDLEIEASLERVRTVAMSMNKPDDLLDVCQIISEQLEMLYVSYIRNVQVAIIDEPKKLYSNYQFFTPYSKKVFEETAYENNPASKAMVTEMQKSVNSFFIGSIKDDELQEFRKWRKKYKQVPDPVLDKSSAVYYYFYSIGKGGLGLTTYQEISNVSLEIFKRFHKVFALAYSRFIDIQQAEARAYEARIETALERVRAIAMAMHNPNDLSSIGKIIFNELKALGFESIRNTEIVINNDDTESVISYHYSDYGKEEIIDIGYKDNPIVKKWAEDLKKAEDAFVPVSIPKKELQSWDEYRLSLGYQSDPKMASAKGVHYYSYSTGLGALSVSTWQTLSDDQIKVLGQFRNVFKLSYQRYKDIEQADAQAREAQIELALERVRARTMAMQKSHELKEVIQVIFNQLGLLNINAEHAGIVVDYQPKKDWHFWIAETQDIPSKVTVPYLDLIWDRQFTETKKKGKDFFTTQLDFEEKNSFYEKLLPHIQGLTRKAKNFYLKCDGLAISTVIEKDIGLYIENFSGIPYTDAENSILRRFGKVFQQTYTRFLDLKKSEAQAREAQIQLGLERVRARAMAMHKSEQLAETAKVLFEQFNLLGKIPDRMSIGIVNEETRNFELWVTDQKGDTLDHPFLFRLDETTSVAKIYIAWKKKKASIVVELTGQELRDWLQFLKNEVKLPINAANIKDRRVHHAAFFSHGFLLLTSQEPVAEEIMKLLVRFAGVFDLTYTRFLDLKQAEAQAREAQIEAALERVRAKSMAMHKSDELADLSLELVKQVQALGVETWFCAFNIYDDSPEGSLEWGSNGQGTFPKYRTPREGIFLRYLKAGQKGEKLFINEIDENECPGHYEYLCSLPGVGEQLLKMKDAGIPFPSSQIDHVAFFKYGYILFITFEPAPEAHDIFKRFAKVFEQTYTRFLDLQKAEEQAREAQIEAALERVRASTMAMHASEELSNVAAVLLEQMKLLGGDLFAFGIVLCDKHENMVEQWHSIGEGEMLTPFLVPVDLDYIHRYRYDQWKAGEKLFSIEIPEDYIAKHFELMFELPTVKAGMKEMSAKGIEVDIPDWEIDYGATFSHGYLLVSSLKPFKEAFIFPRFAKVFEQAYTRFLDLKKAEAQAREAQIEAALEKVRSRSLAMHTTNELGEVVVTLVEKLKDLGVVLDANGIVLCTYFDDSKDVLHWIASPDFSFAGSYLLPYFKHPIFDDAWESKESGTKYFSKAFSKDEKDSFFKYAFEHSDYKNFPEDFKQWVFQNDKHILSFAWQKNSAILIPSHTGVLPSEEDVEILKRFAKVFEQSYVRFLDLKKAEVQAREAQIELSLERIRAQVTSMQKSSDLLDIVVTMRTEFVSLGHEAHYFWYMRYHPETYEKAMTSGDGTKIGMVMSLPRHIHGDIKLIDDWEKSDEPTVVFPMDVETAVEYIHKMITLGDFKQVDPNAPTLDDIRHIGGLTFIMARTAHGEIGYSLPGVVPDPPKEDLNILTRFAGVFDLAYRRFEDLKTAEQRNRETQIELALERVRSKTMAMHNSNDMANTVVTLFEEVLKLGLDNDIRCGIGILEGTARMETRSATLFPNGEVDLKIGMLDMTIHPLLQRIKNGWERGEKHYVDQMAGKDVTKYYTALNNEPDYPFQRELDTLPEIEYHNSFSFPEGIIFAFSPNQMSAEAARVFERFARVFGQTYRRYRDLLKAEEQAREAKIEAALERVRSKAMAMHSSEDLGLTVDTFFSELIGLNVSPHRCGLGIIDKETKIVNVQAIDTNGSKSIKKVVGNLKLSGHPVLDKIFENWQLQKEYFPVLKGKEIMEYYNVMNPQVKFHEFADDEVQYGYYFYFKEGGVYAWTDSELPERDLQIFRRYSSVLSLTYRRYLDLKEAEAQAREAKIEASLERIRSRALSMQKSTEVGAVNDVLFDEFEKMGIEMVGCGISVIDEESDKCEQWRARQIGIVDSFEPFSYKRSEQLLDENLPEIHSQAKKAWKNGDPFYKMELKGKHRDLFLEAVAELFNYNKSKRKKLFNSLPDSFITYYIYYKKGWLSLSTKNQLTEEEISFSRRFVEAFDFAHTRFLDLQKAEAQAKEATKQASLDRVRGEIASMRSPEDLRHITPLIWSELEILEVPFIRCGVFMIDESNSNVQVHLTTPDGKPIGALDLPIDANELTNNTVKHWRNKKVYTIHWNKEDFVNWMQTMISLGQVQTPEQYQGYSKPPESLDLHFIPFKQGMLYVGNTEPLLPEKVDLVKTLAQAFSIAYARYEDFIHLEEAKARVENTLSELKSAQTQLVHAEKMASLGELTAGIAHEIQNPLNFVNNFSEVSVDLMEEMDEEMTLGNTEEVKDIANDLKQNLEKIHHHGKRASFIVQGMLEHSRTNPGDKKPTDINVLADEFLRLSYHGLRAKDKSFNAEIITDFDKDLPQINVIPQDFGRVLLNIVNNAFYAVAEKQKLQTEGYQPSVLVSTKKIGDKVEVRVKDNGKGIPDDVLKKIFQPFFTTKPTGEGTGLGLSMSYDIITKGHGGKLEVETKEGEGTTFIIIIPFKS